MIGSYKEKTPRKSRGFRSLRREGFEPPVQKKGIIFTFFLQAEIRHPTVQWKKTAANMRLAKRR
jgi:hypothetical protein